MQHGEWAGKVIFPDTKAALCTDADFNQRNDANHHTGETTPLEQLFVCLVSQFAIDLMHLQYLGVVQKTIVAVVNKFNLSSVRFGNNAKKLISDLLTSFHHFVPHDFQGNVDHCRCTSY